MSGPIPVIDKCALDGHANAGLRVPVDPGVRDWLAGVFFDIFRHQGNVFFVHTKFLLIDPLSDDPLVCSGSANFSSNSLINNDENMLLIRGDTRVADIYLTEFDRVFRHFYSRDVINELGRSKKGSDVKAAFLDETNAWTAGYFMPGHIKTNRRLMFLRGSEDDLVRERRAGQGARASPQDTG